MVHADQPDRTPSRATLLVGTHDGMAALLRTATGAIVWRTSSGREVGTLAHDGARVYTAYGNPLRRIQGHWRESAEQRRWRHERLHAEPARLEARDAATGRLIWRRADWRLTGRLDMGADAASGVVIVASTSIYGDRALHGLDARTGATLWTRPTTSTMEVNGQRFAVRGGRIFCYGEGKARGVLVLDAATGRPLWSRDGWSELAFSPGGQVVVEQGASQDEKPIARTLDPATGAVRQEFVLDGYVRAVTDAGIAYLSTAAFDEPGLAAVRLEDRRELWRGSEVLAYQIAATEDAVYCARVLVSPNIGEVEALDAHTGRRLWRWRTPGDLRALLRLWGVRRIPRIAAESALLAGKAIAAALAQTQPRNALLHELHYGQRRHPYALHSAINAMWLAADAHAAYLGTWLGVFALRASDGRLLWHALPTTDVSFVSPALPPSAPTLPAGRGQAQRSPSEPVPRRGRGEDPVSARRVSP